MVRFACRRSSRICAAILRGTAMIRFGCVVLLLSGCIVGDATEPVKDKHAEAAIAPTAANTVTGTIKFTLHDGKVSAVVEAANAPEGVHGFHIHLNPACGMD